MTAPKMAYADLPFWPRLLKDDMAAAYLGISPNTLKRLPVQGLRIGCRTLWDRHRLDEYVDRLAAADTPTSNTDAFAILDRLAANDPKQPKKREKRAGRAPS